MGSGKTSYEEVVSPSDYQNINPLGNEAFLNLFGNVDNFTRQLQGNTSSDPLSSIRQFLGIAPELQGLAMGATSDLERGLRDQSQRMVDESTSQVASEFSNLGSLYSGAAVDTAARRAGEIGGNLANQLGMQQLGLVGNMWNQGLGGLMQGQQNQLSMLGNLYNLQSGMAAPTMVAPTMAANYEPSFTEKMMPWLNFGLNAATGLGWKPFG
jgi:hypothetical protein